MPTSQKKTQNRAKKKTRSRRQRSATLQKHEQKLPPEENFLDTVDRTVQHLDRPASHSYTLSRLPIEYFKTSGCGQADYGSHETASYDSALREAQIADQNMLLYTSLVPREALEIPRSEGRKKLRWGNVLEAILAVTNASEGQMCTAAIMLTRVYSPEGEYMGIFADEYSSTTGDLEDGKQNLLEAATGMMHRRGYGAPSPKNLELIRQHGPDIVDNKVSIETSTGHVYRVDDYFGRSFRVTQKFGTALAGVCFTKFRFPVLDEVPVKHG